MVHRFLVWLGAGVLVAGFSTATIAGAGLAAAEDGAAAADGKASAESTDSTAANDDSPDNTVEADPDDDPTDDPVDGAEDVDDPGEQGQDEDADRPRNNRRSIDAEQKQEARSLARLSADTPDEDTEVANLDAAVDETSRAVVQQNSAAIDDDAVSVTQAVVDEAPEKTAPTSKPKEPDVADTIIGAVSSVVGTLLSPFASNSQPEVPPAAEPQLWTLAAASRREFETAFESQSLEQQPAEVQNSLTYTPPPTFKDQIVLMIHETLRVITDVTGIQLHYMIGGLLATESPPFFLTFGLDTRRTVFTAEDGVQWQVWEFHPPNPTEKTVLAFHGGGFIFEPNVLHWIDYTSMARETGATVIVPLYPLATTEAGRATVVIPEAGDFISDQIELHGAENVSLYADSGGSLITMSAVRQLLLAGRPVPSSMVHLGLAADLSSSNPDIRNIDDPLFDIDNAEKVWASHYYDGITDRRDPLVSSLFFEDEVLKALPPTTLYVGTREILYPDTLLLHQRAVELGAPISVVVGTGLVHTWPLSGSSLLGYSQTSAARPDVYRQLGLTDDATTVDAVANLQAPEAIPAVEAVSVEASSIDEQVAPAAENSLTYTPPPSFQDQFTLVFHEIMRVVSKVTGINTTQVLGSLLASKNPPFFLTFGLDTRKTVFTSEDGTQWDVWEIRPPEPTGKTVIAFHGGGWIQEAGLLNWTDYTAMARETGATVIVPIYPLATTPAGKATEVIPDAADLISQRIQAAGGPENVSLYGDSAGASIAASAMRELLLGGKPVPSSMVLVSLVADASLQNPDIRNVDDPLFDVDNAEDVWASHYYDGVNKADPLVSPLFWTDDILTALPPTTIYVGEREILYPDTLLLHDRAVDLNAPISVVVGTGLVHDWPASGFPVYTQTGKVRPDMYRQLGLTEDASVDAVAELQAPEAIPALAEAEPVAQPSLINIVGSFGWGLFDTFSNAFLGQPQVPPGSTVRVERSTLELDCGPGYTVDADWYFPDTEEPPTRLIYFQHGFPGASVVYDYTAAELAERNDAIVVATTISSNLFDCYACNLGGDPMHAAVGKLFIGEREELLASARAAGFEGETLPERFVLVGHSGGGQLAGGAAGYFEEFAPDAEDYNLAGVILLDTSPVGGAIERGLDKIPEDIAVYTISAAPSFLNSKGGMNRALVAARPGEFVGVELVNGAHGDGFQSHNPIVQLGGSLFSMAFSRPENVEAVQVIAQGWIDDWYEGTDTGLDGVLGSTVDVPGADGARAYVLPTPAPQLTFIDLIVDAALRSTLLFKNFQTCAEDPSAGSTAASSCSAGPASEAL